jgi:bifunctional UDP-N-acetylglucosamine pyrophosphorylase/glucosamine-1-phosphate N-acetyltransferase
MSLSIVILAAGQGTRMCCALPKLLNKLAGKPILEHLLKTVGQVNPTRIIVVYGYKGEELKKAFAHFSEIVWVEQKQQLGSGHAALQALPFLKGKENDKVLLLAGDNPLISQETLKKLLDASEQSDFCLLTHMLENPNGLGRIIRNTQGKVEAIIEEKDATAEQKKIKEINASVYCVGNGFLQSALAKITAHNAQKEYYLTDLVTLAVNENKTVETVSPKHDFEVQGINDKIQLAALERVCQAQEALKWMQKGLTLRDPARFDVRGEVSIGQDVIIDVNVILEGNVKIGNDVSIGPNTYIKDSVILDKVIIKANCVIENAIIGEESIVGPFARLRPGAQLEEKVHIGNFVEVKNSTIGIGSKINHLAYIGDAKIGTCVNIGAGVITCNYDGELKHQTVIGDHAFIGSDTQLIAPVTIGHGVTVGAGTTITKDIPSNYLVHNRIEHRIIEKQPKG